MLKKLLQRSFLWRWHVTLCWLARGVRIHPTACLYGTTGSFNLGRGTKIGGRTRLLPGRKGDIILGRDVWLSSDIEIEAEGCVRIGDRSSIQRRGTINGSVRIGRDCIFAPNVFLSSGTHPFRVAPHLPIREQEALVAADPAQDRPIWIQDDCWLGINVVICPGVVLGKGAVVGANAVVTRDVPPYTVVAGAPARKIGERLTWLPPSIIDPALPTHRPYILSGTCVESAGEPARIQITADEYLLVALTPPLADPKRGRLLVQARAARETRLETATGIVVFPAGTGEISLSSENLTFFNEAWSLKLAFSDSAREQTLDIFQIRWVSDV